MSNIALRLETKLNKPVSETHVDNTTIRMGLTQVFNELSNSIAPNVNSNENYCAPNHRDLNMSESDT